MDAQIVVEAKVVQRDDIRMVELADCASFILEARGELVGVATVEKLHGDRPVDRELRRRVDGPRCPLAEQFVEAIATIDDLSEVLFGHEIPQIGCGNCLVAV